MALPIEKASQFSAKHRLVELIDGLTEDQCERLLQKLERWKGKDRRRDPRRPCSVPVDYATEDRVFKGFIKDISSGGVFVESQKNLDVGEEITLTFTSPDLRKPMKITGEIVRKNLLGVGVKFKRAMEEIDGSTWIDCRRTTTEVRDEKRTDPRVEFQCPVQIEGFRGGTTVTDLSLGGAFIECPSAFGAKLRVGQTVGLNIKLPTEDEMVRVEAEVVKLVGRGMHCRFVNLGQKTAQAIQVAFNLARYTLPIR